MKIFSTWSCLLFFNCFFIIAIEYDIHIKQKTGCPAFMFLLFLCAPHAVDGRQSAIDCPDVEIVAA